MDVGEDVQHVALFCSDVRNPIKHRISWSVDAIDESIRSGGEFYLPAVNTEPLAVPKMEMTTPSGTRKLAGPRTILAQS